MKRIFFLLSSMNVGGVEKAFLNFISVLPESEYEIHLGVLYAKGGFLTEIPDHVHVHIINCYDKYKRIINDPPLSVIKEMLYKGRYAEAFIHSLLYLHFKITANRYWLYQYILKDEPNFPITFDLAVAYAGPSQSIDYYICKKVQAKKKIGWIHFDILKFGIDQGMTRRLYKTYNKIFVVSKVAKEHFDQIFPKFKNKTEIFYNVVSPIEVQKQADRDVSFDDDFSGKRILTVGRISPEKGQNYAIEALKILVEKGYPVKWYFVGDGHFRKECEELVMKYQLEEYVAFLGTKKNPYPYMKDCDIYVQPSRHEGYCITLAEAKVFGMPIVATDFVGAREQLQERTNAEVTGFSPTEIATGIVKVMHYSKQPINDECDSLTTDLNNFLTILK